MHQSLVRTRLDSLHFLTQTIVNVFWLLYGVVMHSLGQYSVMRMRIYRFFDYGITLTADSNDSQAACCCSSARSIMKLSCLVVGLVICYLTVASSATEPMYWNAVTGNREGLVVASGFWMPQPTRRISTLMAFLRFDARES